MLIVVIVCGEGGSGGALGIAIGDRVICEFLSGVIPPVLRRHLWRCQAEGRSGGGSQITALTFSRWDSSTRS
jgi:hypothetical protein